MRAFIALEMPDPMVAEMVEMARLLTRSVSARFMPRENYHVTLAFLGEIGEAEAARAVDALEAACEGRGPVELRPDGLGTFGRSNDATLWLGLVPNGNLIGLADRVHAELEDRGVGYEKKPFRPHATIARRARIPRGELPALTFPRPALATRAVLYRSILDAAGAEYKPLHTVEL